MWFLLLVMLVALFVSPSTAMKGVIFTIVSIVLFVSNPLLALLIIVGFLMIAGGSKK